MSAAVAELINTNETEPFPRQLSWGSDYNARKDTEHGFKEWFEAMLYDNGDGTRTLFSTMQHYENGATPETGCSDSTVDYGFRSREYSMYSDSREITRRMAGPIGPALRMIGLRAEEASPLNSDDKYYEVTYPSAEELAKHFERIGNHTGFAAKISVYNGGFFDRPGIQEEAFSNGEVILSDEPESEAHDIINHGITWLFMPKKLMERLGGRTKRLHEAFQNQKDTSKPEYWQARDELSRHMSNIEVSMDKNILGFINQCLEGDDNYRPYLENEIGAILFGFKERSEEEKLEIQGHANDILERARQLIQMGQEQERGA
jgi:hypothetical protein